VSNCNYSVSAVQSRSCYRGLVQAGACSCFDQFKPMTVEMGSAIAGQFNYMGPRCARTRNASIARGREVSLTWGSIVLIKLSARFVRNELVVVPG
jgi:hypothetical protein